MADLTPFTDVELNAELRRRRRARQIAAALDCANCGHKIERRAGSGWTHLTGPQTDSNRCGPYPPHARPAT